MREEEDRIGVEERPEMVFELSHRAVLQVCGADALRYLNGQITQDLRRLSLGEGLPACVTSAKGKLVAVVNVWREEDGFGLDVEEERAEVLRERLERYVVADDVEVHVDSGDGVFLHVLGRVPEQISGFGGVKVVRMNRLGEWGWDVRFAQAEREEQLRNWGGNLASSELWERLRVERGIPAWGSELGEDTLPPEAGLEATHIDYHKGCYMGQEVISRLKSVGQVNRRLVRLYGEDALALPEVGASLLVESGAGMPPNGVAGKITSAVWGEPGEVLALAYVRRGVEAEDFEAKGVGKLRRVR